MPVSGCIKIGQINLPLLSKVALRSSTYFELLLAASLTSLVIFTVLLTFQRKWKLVL